MRLLVQGISGGSKEGSAQAQWTEKVWGRLGECADFVLLEREKPQAPGRRKAESVFRFQRLSARPTQPTRTRP
ncbi:hypothetical protein EMIT0324P_10365 [Pseudomonas chlororaphis]